MKKELILSKVKEFAKEEPWNHQFELPHKIKTISNDNLPDSAGNNIKKWERICKIAQPNIFKNKKVLDIGCSDGYFSIKACAYANKVVGIDLDNLRIERANFIKSILEVKNCDFQLGS